MIARLVLRAAELVPMLLASWLVGLVLPANAGARQDCEACPVMVELPRGSFMLGSKAGEGESDEFVFADGLPDPVAIQHRLSLSRSEVTRGQFTAFVRATGYETTAEKSSGCSVFLPNAALDHQRVWHWRSPGFRQSNEHPVVCVSWLDAQAYVQWLRRVTGKAYRLPSEAEFEYAARAGSEPRYGSVSDAGALCRLGNVADRSLLARQPGWTAAPCKDGFANTAPTGSQGANAWGLQDLIGNVSEWVADCYHPRHGIYAPGPGGGKRLPNAGSARVDGCPKPLQRVIKGGSWAFGPEFQRVAWRGKEVPQFTSNDLGFRVARDD